MYVPHASKVQEDIRSPGVGATNACEPPCRCWKPNHHVDVGY